MSRLRPKVVMWWGIGLIAATFILNYTLPGLSYAAYGGGLRADALSQALLGGFATLLGAVNSLAPLLGAVLIGASIVMAYIAKTVLPPAQQPAAGESDTRGIAEQDAAS